MFTNLNKISCDFSRYGVFLSFSGPMSQDLMVEMGNVLKTKMRLEGADMTTILKVFSILIELNQNIIHYSEERIGNELANGKHLEAEPDATGCGLIAIGKEGKNYFIVSGNAIRKTKIETLTQKLEALNSMSREELKQTYREKRKSRPEDDSKGAGLGFIEVARKSSQPLEFKFESISNELAFFSLKTTI